MTPRWFSICFASTAALACHLALGPLPLAQASPDKGTGDDAMPGTFRADSAEEMREGVALSVSSSYGFTGATLESADSHHRGAAKIAAAYSLSADLAVALRLDGRYDKHFMEAGRDDGWVGDPRLIARYRHTLGPSLSAGVQLGLWAPGSNAPSIEMDALSVEAVGALTWAPIHSSLKVSANLGYRVDRSAASVSEPERLSLPDRMSLGASDYNAVLAAIGVNYDVGPAEVLAEWSLDLLHGSGAPEFRSSPMRIAFGARRELSNGWWLFGMSEFRVSKVDATDVAEMLLPFDPTVSALVGLQLRFGATPKNVVDEDLVDDNKEDLDPPEKIEKGPLRGRVLSMGEPVAGATLVFVDASGEEHTAITDDDGAYEMESVALGAGTLKVSADGFEDDETSISVTSEGPSAEVKLEPKLPPGQLRGQVRSFRGTGLASKLSVEPGGQSIETDSDGSFELDLPPGDYEVTITVAGFNQQTRSIHIEENGVTIMNVDLRKGDQSKGNRR